MPKEKGKRKLQKYRIKPGIGKHDAEVTSKLPVPTWRIIFTLFTCVYTLIVISAGIYLHHVHVNRSKAYIKAENRVSKSELTRAIHAHMPVDFPLNIVDHKSPCFGPQTLTLDGNFNKLMSRVVHLTSDHVIKIKERLSSKFRLTNQNVLHIPDWASKLFNGTIDKDSSDYKLLQPPYFLTAVVRLRLYKNDKAKLTMSELKQWIHYQLWAGAEHVYICNHFLDDSERIEPGLKRYIDLGLVTVYPWNTTVAIPGTQSYLIDNSANQDGCYNYVLRHHGNQTVWQYNMDMDEYPFIPSDQCEGFFKRYLFNLDHGGTKALVSQIKLSNFLMKGVGDRTRDMSIDRINRIDRTRSNPLVKPAYKTGYTTQVGTHGVTTDDGQTLYPAPHEIVMVHYWGARSQNWGPDTDKTIRETVEFNIVRETIAVNVRHSLLALADFQGFNDTTGP